MSVGNVISHFDAIGKVPVDIRDVLAKVIDECPGENLRSIGLDISAVPFRGGFYEYAEPAIANSALTDIRHSVAWYSTQQDNNWQRLVACKEILHALERDPVKTKRAEDALLLIQKLAKPSAQYSSENKMQSFFDELAKWQAIAVLFPFGLWADVYPKVASGVLDVSVVADWLELPQPFVDVVMHEEWETLRANILTGT